MATADLRPVVIDSYSPQITIGRQYLPSAIGLLRGHYSVESVCAYNFLPPPTSSHVLMSVQALLFFQIPLSSRSLLFLVPFLHYSPVGAAGREPGRS